MDTTLLDIDTGSQRGVFDLTDHIRTFVAGRPDGLVSVFAPHATAGVAIIEVGAGSDDDLMAAIDRLLPRSDAHYRHRHGAEGHGADHVLPALISPSLTIPTIDGRPALGTWQSVVLVDPNADNPKRRIRLTYLTG